jgi:hypothetical protein
LASRVAYAGTGTTGAALTAANVNNLPGGWIGYVERVTDSSTWTTAISDVAGMSQAVTVNANRKIRISACFSVTTSTEDAHDFYIREGSTALRGVRHVWGNISPSDFIDFSVVLNPSAGSHTYKLSAEKANAGTGNILASGTNPAFLLIEDLGPSS